MGKRFVFLDRDGTIIFDKHYLHRPEEVEMLPNAVEGLRTMQAMGLGLVIVTNQSGIGRGYFTLADFHATHARLVEMLAAEGVTLDGMYYCPHAPNIDCDCRKPLLGMITHAQKVHPFTPADCFVVGDKPCDIDLGKNMGAKTILVRTGEGTKWEPTTNADFVVDDLIAAAKVIEQALSARARS